MMRATTLTTTSTPQPTRGHCARIVSTIALSTLLLGGCSKGSQAETLDGEPSGRLLVFAAASLTDAFNDVAKGFRDVYPGIDVKLNYAGSQSLRTQIEQGARAQVFASANAKHLHELHARGLVAEPSDFAINQMVIVTPTDNPAGISSLADLPKAERLVLAGTAVPAGAYAKQVLSNAGATLGADFAKRVDKRVVSREMHVRQTLQKVVLGEADAAMVYATDAAAAGTKVKTIEIPAALNVEATYPIATVKDAPNQRAARLFIEFLGSAQGRGILEKHGFRTPAQSAGAAETSETSESSSATNVASTAGGK